MKQKLLKTLLLLCALIVGSGSVWATDPSWTHDFSSPEAISDNSITVSSATWTVSTTSGTGSPTMSTGTYSKIYGLKFGSSSSNYYGSVTFSTDYFQDYNVKSVTVNILNNGKKTGTLTVQQGATTIGSDSKEFASTWTDLTANTNEGSGGSLSITYSVAQAFYIHSITVVYTTGGSSTYSVTYNGNGATSGTVPTDASSPYASGATVTVLGNTGSLAKTGYIFDGWNTKADGTGTDRTVGSTFTISANTTLYAKWTDSRTTTDVIIDGSGITNTNLFSGTTAGSLTATVKAGESTVDGATVSWSSGTTSVATIDATGAVTLVGAGKTIITASYEGDEDYKPSSKTYELTVTNEDPSLVEIWSEDFASSGYSTRTSTYGYTTTNSSDVQSSDNYAGGEAPEMMLKATGGTFSATIPLNNGYTGDLKMKFKSNANAITVSSGTTGVSMSGTATFSTKGTHEVTFTGITAENTEINIVFTAGSSNVRLDDIVLKGKEAPAQPTFSEAAKYFNSSFNTTISSAEGTTLKYTTDGTNPAESGTATAVAANSKTITISGTENVTVKAIAIKDEVNSAVASVTYTYDTRPAPTFTLSTTEKTIYNFSDDQTISLTTNSDGAVTFESSDDTKLDVDNSDDSKIGVLSAVEAGDYTITVRTAATENYLAAEGTVTVHVIKKPTTMVIDTDFSEGKDLRYGDEGLIEGKVQYNSVDLSPQPTITYTSSNESVATVNSDGEITFVSIGSTTLKAAFAGNDEYDACEETYVLEIIDSTPQVMEVTIPLNSTSLGSTAPNGKTASVNYVSATTNKGSASNDLYATDAQVRMYKNSNMVVSAPSGYVITDITMTEPTADTKWDGDPTASVGTYSSKSWSGSASSVTFTFSGGQCRLASITVTLAENITITSAGYATYASDHHLNFTGKSIKAYIATTKGDGTGVNFTQVYKVPAGTGVLLYKDGGTTEAIPVFDGTGADDTDGNKFVRGEGETVATDDGTNYNYILNNGASGIGFYRANDKMVATNRAYISILKSESASVKGFIALPGSEETAVEAVKAEAENGVIFNLAGQRVQKLQRGINIVNGRKVVVK